MWPDFTRISLRIPFNDDTSFKSYEEVRETFIIACVLISKFTYDVGYADMVFVFANMEAFQESRNILNENNIKYVTDVHIGEY